MLKVGCVNRAELCARLRSKCGPLWEFNDVLNRHQDGSFNLGFYDLPGGRAGLPVDAVKWSWMRRIGVARRMVSGAFRPYRHMRRVLFRVCPKESYHLLHRLLSRSMIYIGRPGTYNLAGPLYETNRLFVALVDRPCVRTAYELDGKILIKTKRLPPHHFVVTDYHSKRSDLFSLCSKAVKELIDQTVYGTQSDTVVFRSECDF